MTETDGAPRAEAPGDGLVVFRSLRHLGLAWVCLTAPAVTWLSTRVDTPRSYVFVFVVLACGTYTTPGLVAGWYAVRRAPVGARLAFRVLYLALVIFYLVGVGMLVGLVTGWRWANPVGVPAVAASGMAHNAGLAVLVRTRSGRRAPSVDLVEAVAAVVAVTAPLVVLWGPAVVHAEHAWFTVPAALTLVFCVAGVYWTTVLCVRLGPDTRPFAVCVLVLACVGTINAGLQTAQGVSGFSLPVPPLIAFNCVTVSLYLLVPLYVPRLLPPGLDRLPPQAQVRGARLATVVALAGLGALLAATALVADERPWTMGFALGVVSLLFVLAAIRQLAALGETRSLYRQVELASEERGRLLGQMIERAAHDRRRVAGQLHEQAVAAAASFATLAGSSTWPAEGSPLASEASALVRGELGRHADALRHLVLALRSRSDDRPGAIRLATPIAAYVASIYGDVPAPDLEVRITEDLWLDWVTETVVLQIVHEAVRNVWCHSHATSVAIVVRGAGSTVEVRVTDDGDGFDTAAVPLGAGIASMRSSAAVVDGTVTVSSSPGGGTSVRAQLGRAGEAGDRPSDRVPEAAPPSPLRLVPPLGDERH